MTVANESARRGYPYEADRFVVRAFLHQDTGRAWRTGDTLQLSATPAATLRYAQSDQTLAWYDSVGALTVQLIRPRWVNQSVAVIEYMAELLGISERFTREERGDDTDIRKRELHYFLDGQPVGTGAPFVLAGTLTVAAFCACDEAEYEEMITTVANEVAR